MSKKTSTPKNGATIAVPTLDTKAVIAAKERIAKAEAVLAEASATLKAEHAAFAAIMSAYNAEFNKAVGFNVLGSVAPSSAVQNGTRGSQKQAVLDLLANPNGVTCKEIAAAIGTSEHNIQGALTNIRRGLGERLVGVKVDGVTRYHVSQ